MFRKQWREKMCSGEQWVRESKRENVCDVCVCVCVCVCIVYKQNYNQISPVFAFDKLYRYRVIACFQAPNERARLYFLLAWFHAIIQERMRYTPLGWAKKYEFTESDLRVACDMLDTWVDSVAMVSTCWSSAALWTQAWAAVTGILLCAITIFDQACFPCWSQGVRSCTGSFTWNQLHLQSTLHLTFHNYGHLKLQAWCGEF